MPPDAGEMFEIGSLVFDIIRVIPEFDRHGWKRLCAAQLALFTGNRLAVIIKNINRKAKRARLDLARMHRLDSGAKNKASHDIGAARH